MYVLICIVGWAMLVVARADDFFNYDKHVAYP